MNASYFPNPRVSAERDSFIQEACLTERHSKLGSLEPLNRTKISDSFGGAAIPDRVAIQASGHGKNAGRPKLLVWSAADEDGISRLVSIYSDHFAQLCSGDGGSQDYLEGLACTLATRRSSLPWKSFAVASDVFSLTELRTKLSQPSRSADTLGLGFIFTGQGAQWHAMGRELLIYPVFRNSLLTAGEELRGQGCQWSLLGTQLNIWRKHR